MGQAYGPADEAGYIRAVRSYIDCGIFTQYQDGMSFKENPWRSGHVAVSACNKAPRKSNPHASCVRHRKWLSKKEGKLTTNYQVVNHLSATYAKDEAIAEAKAKITSFKQLEPKSAARYSEVLWAEALRCGRVYIEALLGGVFIEGLYGSVEF